jgi:flagellar basal-body rod protein FlgC
MTVRNDFTTALGISAAGLAAEGARLRVIAENLANANTTATTPGGEPYRRQIATFKETLDKELGVKTVAAGDVVKDMSDLPSKFDPTHPAADANGYIKTPNVKPMVEMMDMRQAQRAYEANLTAIEASKAMASRTLDIIRS